ncbi:MAG: 4-alpha-glucanotransferase [Deltaproteobacteria bacterium]|nr:4-alpha-glucanotransferase [Deltaproteobacteria bacterium]
MNPLPPDIEGKAAAPHWDRIGAHKRFGICVPLFSLRSENDCGIGDIGDLYGLVDWCRASGATVIQVLPLNDMGLDHVPYASLSAFAMDPVYLSLGRIPAVAGDGALLQRVREVARELNARSRIDYDAVRRAKMAVLAVALKRWEPDELTAELESFLSRNEWLVTYLAFRVIKEVDGFQSWETWGDRWSETAIRAVPATHCDLWRLHLFAQWLLDVQLRGAARYAHEKGVLLMGDVPILVSRDSADVWGNPGYFRLDTCAGAPPDMYSESGQTWGFPTYDWNALRADDNAWWRARLAHAQQYFDLYRIDHVVGFFRIWTLRNGAPDGRDGWFEPRDQSAWGHHGHAILSMMLDATSMLPLAEDLGTIPPVCRETLRDLGICGLKVQRWERRWDTDRGYVDPADYDPVSLATWSTHDTEVLTHWWASSPGERQLLYQASGHEGEAPQCLEPGLHRDLTRWLSSAPSRFLVLALQDVLSPLGVLDGDSALQRINLPGVVNDTNWTWRCPVTLESLLEDPRSAASVRAMITPDRLPPPQSIVHPPGQTHQNVETETTHDR